MKILVATASRHGATKEIGARIAMTMTSYFEQHHNNSTVVDMDASDVDSVADYDAVVLGSAVYMGRWMKDARRLIDREQESLMERPVWLFSSGPIDDGATEPVDPALHKTPWAREHRTFRGKLNRAKLSRVERVVASAIKAEDSDDRPWESIAQWATSIAVALTVEHVG